jgi:hypothetical protein
MFRSLIRLRKVFKTSVVSRVVSSASNNETWETLKLLFKANEDLAKSFWISNTNEKDLRIQEKDLRIHDKDQLVKRTEELVFIKDRELMEMKGLVSCRGIFEVYMQLVYNELKHLGTLTANETFNMTSLITKITAPKFTPLEGAYYTKAFLEQLKLCGCDDPLLMHATFCSGIHGAPWSGTAVRMYKSVLPATYVCMVGFMAGTFKLNVLDVGSLDV